MQTARRLGSMIASLPPCCLRFDPQNPSIVLLGTYQLEKETGARHGSIEICLIALDGSLGRLNIVETKLAVLDMKFSPRDPLLLVLAHSTGNLTVWHYENARVKQVHDMAIFDESILITSVFFDPLCPSRVLATATSGEAAIVDLESQETTLMSTTHDLECWTGAFGEIGPTRNVLFTGGDDAKLIAHDLRTQEKVWATSHRHHDAGVVLVLCPSEKWNNSRPNSLWTGSYDDCLRIFDLRKLDTDEGPVLYPGSLPQETFKENLNGGVWRLIPDPNSEKVLACCMYDGARIVEPTETGAVVTRYFKGDHESMCYGGDWQDNTIVTCSFYDKVVQNWLPTAV